MFGKRYIFFSTNCTLQEKVWWAQPDNKASTSYGKIILHFICGSISTIRWYFRMFGKQRKVKHYCQLLACSFVQTECRRLNHFYECGVYLQSAPMRFHAKPMKIFKLLFFVRPSAWNLWEQADCLLFFFSFFHSLWCEWACVPIF